MIMITIPVVFAECPPDCEDSSNDIDYSSSDDVNNMEPQDLASAIEQGKISDMSIVDDNKLADALNNNPSISIQLENGDLARAVNQDLSLLGNPSVMSDFDSRAQSDTHILNDNPNIKKKWFADKGIKDEGGELEIYDGLIVKTKGSQATTFNVNDHPGARVTKNGKLILANGAEIESAEVTRSEDESININGGHTDLSKSQSANIHVNQGIVQIGDKIYTSADNTPVDVSIKDEKATITGTNVVEAQNGITTATFSGEVTTFADGHKTFSKGTEYVPYLDGKRSKKYNVDGLTEYHTTADCDGSRNCIQDVDGNVRVVSKDNNKINIEQYDNSITSLKIDQISDNSLVTFNDKENVELEFSKGPLVIRGDINALSFNVESTFVNNNDEAHTFMINNGLIIQCSEPCKISGDIVYHKKRFNQLKKSMIQIDSDKSEVLGDGTKLYYQGENILIIDAQGNEYFMDDNGDVYSISDDHRLKKIDEQIIHNQFSQEFINAYEKNKQKLAPPSTITQVSIDRINRRLEKQIDYADIKFTEDTKIQDIFRESIGSKEYQVVRTDKGDIIVTQEGQRYAFIYEPDAQNWKYLDILREEMVYRDVDLSELSSSERKILQESTTYETPDLKGYILGDKDLDPIRSIAKYEIKDQTGSVVGYYVSGHGLQESPHLLVGDKKIEIDPRVLGNPTEKYFKTTRERKMDIEQTISRFYSVGSDNKEYLRNAEAYTKDDQIVIKSDDGHEYYLDEDGSIFKISSLGKMEHLHDTTYIQDKDIASYIDQQLWRRKTPETIVRPSIDEMNRRMTKKIGMALTGGTLPKDIYRQSVGSKEYEVMRSDKGDVVITQIGQKYAFIFDSDSKKWLYQDIVRDEQVMGDLDMSELSTGESRIVRESTTYEAPDLKGYILGDKDLDPIRSIAKYEIKDQTGSVVGYYVSGHGLQESPHLLIGDKKIEVDSRVSGRQIEEYFQITK
jgi:hypothetical protein